MPMSSSQISQLTAQSQQMGMSQMQHAAMISQQAGFQGGSRNEALGQHMAGSAINTMSSVGGPGMQAGMALAGVDPISMGIKGGMAGYAMGGAAGAMGGAALGMGAVGLPMMAGQYAYGQMAQGAQQQQQLRGQLGQAFQFQNQQGGRGFTGGQVETIGSQFRSMAQQRGPGGEQTSFSELSRLASNMGRMGMAQNVRSVQEFKDQFSKMLKNVKTVAKAMSTSLEEAQEMMQGMRGSGVFKNQGQVAKDIRGTAIGGGLATSEVTGMMRVGSQITRMVGGRGRAGADAGMGAIGFVGAAQKGGILSEEDIYNQTGQTGAEGRRAMATGMLQTSARFMKSGLGRRFLASIAGKGGKVNEAQLREYMAGGVGTGDTMRMAHQNLAKIGRADFIRNEGRLRGAAMGAMGGMAPAMVMSGWLKQRGVDVNSDRAKIMIQRRLKMGTDEADNMMEMIQGLPMMLETRQNRIEDSEHGRRQTASRSHTNVNRLKKKFEDARSKVQNSLRQMGANFQDSMSDFAEKFINTITGDVVTQQARDTAKLTRGFLEGGARGEIASNAMRMPGSDAAIAAGKGSLAQMGREFGRDMGRGQKMRGGHGYMATTNLNRLFTGTIKAGANYESAMEAQMKNSGDWQRFQKAGFGLSEEISSEQLQQQIDSAHESSRRFFAGTRAGSKNLKGTINTDKSRILREMSAVGKFGGGGTDRARKFKEAILADDRPELAGLRERLKNARSNEEISEIMGEEQGAAGMTDESDLTKMQVPGMMTLFTGKGFKSLGAQQEALGKAMFGGVRKKGKVTGVIKAEKGFWEQVGSAFAGAGGVGLASKQQLATQAGKDVEVKDPDEFLTGAQQKMAARMTQSKEFLAEAQGVLSRDENTRRAAVDKVQKRMDKLSAEDRETDVGKAEEATGKALLAAGKMRAAEAKNGGKPVSRAEKQKMADELDMTLSAFEKGAAGTEATVAKAAIVERQAVMQRVSERGRQDALKLTATGFMDAEGNLSKGTAKELGEIGEAGFEGMGPSLSTGEMVGRGIAEMKMLQQKMGERGPGGEMSEGAKEAAKRFQTLQKEQKATINRMSTEDKAKLGKFLAGTPGAEGLGMSLMDESGIEKQLAAGRGTMGKANVVASQMGIRLTEEQLKMSPEKIAKNIVSQSAVTGDEAKKLYDSTLAGITGLDASGKKLGAGERAGKVREARGIAAGGIEARQTRDQDEQAQKNSPSFRALTSMSKSLTSIAQVLTGEKKNVKVTVNINKDSAEDGDTGDGAAPKPPGARVP